LPRLYFWGVVFEIWHFSGAWELVLGLSPSEGSKTDLPAPISRFSGLQATLFLLRLYRLQNS